MAKPTFWRPKYESLHFLEKGFSPTASGSDPQSWLSPRHLAVQQGPLRESAGSKAELITSLATPEKWREVSVLRTELDCRCCSSSRQAPESGFKAFSGLGRRVTWDFRLFPEFLCFSCLFTLSIHFQFICSIRSNKFFIVGHTIFTKFNFTSQKHCFNWCDKNDLGGIFSCTENLLLIWHLSVLYSKQEMGIFENDFIYTHAISDFYTEYITVISFCPLVVPWGPT